MPKRYIHYSPELNPRSHLSNDQIIVTPVTLLTTQPQAKAFVITLGLLMALSKHDMLKSVTFIGNFRKN